MITSAHLIYETLSRARMPERPRGQGVSARPLGLGLVVGEAGSHPAHRSALRIAMRARGEQDDWLG